jgi:hypothetical protein
MQKRKPFGYFMAVFAKSGDSFFRKQELVIAAVWVMALHAIACFQRFVNNLLGSLLQMAVLAKVSTFPLELECVLFRLQLFMACSAVAETDGAVNVCFFAVISVTFFRNARLLRRCWFFHSEPG